MFRKDFIYFIYFTPYVSLRYQLINHKISHGKCEVIDWGAGKQHNFKSCDMACTVDTHKKSTTVKKTTSTT